MESSANEFPAIVGETKTRSQDLATRINQTRKKRIREIDYPELPAKENSHAGTIPSGQFRPLATFELNEVKKIFGASLLYEKIFLTDNVGADQQPFSSQSDKGLFIIHCGLECFVFGASVCESCMNSLVHQLVHVWQQCHGQLANHASSSSCCHESKELNFRAGLHWENYSVEQQALLIEEWFDGGMTEADPRYQYVKNVLQAAP